MNKLRKPYETVAAIKEELKKNDKLKPPVWASFVKTGVNAERPPSQEDWWYSRLASIMRKVYLNGPVGTARLRTAFGGKRRRGHKAPHTRKAGGKIIRLMLQQLEQAGLIKKTDKPRKGRIITEKGQSLIDRYAK